MIVDPDTQAPQAMPPLGDTARDEVVALVKSFVGALPFVGSILGEVIGQLIPQQRLQRIELYLKLLSDRFGRLEPDELNARMRQPESADLFEEGAFQSARALTAERQAYIATVVASGITGEEKQRLESKRLLNLLREVDDAQIIVLASHLRKHERDDDFYNKHRNILEPVRATMGSDDTKIDAEQMQEVSELQLVRLGLLRPRYRVPRKGESPTFNHETGTLVDQGRGLTWLGRKLLRNVGLASNEDW